MSEAEPSVFPNMPPSNDVTRLQMMQSLASIVESTSDAIFSQALDGTILSWNLAAQEIYGYSAAEVIGCSVSLLAPPEHEREIRDILERIKAGERIPVLETERVRQDGRRIHVSLSVSPMLDASGRVIGASTIARDVTERKRMEEALRESARDFRILAESVPQIVWATRPDGWNIYFNQRWVDYTGLTLEESYGHGWNTPFHPEDRLVAWKAWQRAVQDNEPYSLECRLRRADGVYRWWLVRGAPIRGADGQILKWFGTCTDIDEIKQAEEARLRLALEAADLGTWDMDPAMGTVVHSLRHDQIFGYSELQPEWSLEIELRHVLPQDRTIVREAHARAEESGEMSLEARVRWPDGTIHWVNSRGRAHYDSEGRVVRVIGVVADITERKRAEEALRESEERFRIMANSLPQLAWMAGADGFIFWYNQRWYEYTGATSEQMEGWGWQTVHDPDMLPQVLEQWKASIATGEPFNMVFPLRGADGQFRSFLTRVNPLKDSQGRVMQWFGTNTDVDELKRAEDALRESEARYRRLIEKVPIPLGVSNKSGEIVFFNERFTQVFGYTQTDLPTLEAWWQRAYPDATYRRAVAEAWEAKMRRAAETRDPTEPMEFNVTCKDGTVRVTVISNIIIEDNILATFVDITERKRAEEALRLSEEKFTRAFAGNPAAIALTRLEDGVFLDVNESWVELNGYRRDEVLGHSARHMHIWPTAEAASRFVQELRTKGSVRGLEQEFLRKSGELIVVQLSAQILTVQGEQVILSTLVDITERKRAEEALREANAQLREADRYKDEFLAMLAHELRNPLAPVRNAVAVLQYAGSTDPRLQRQSEIIDRQVTHMAKLLDDLLDVSRITRGKIVLQMQPLHLTDALAHAIEIATPIVQARKHTLHVTEPPDELLVEGDPDRLAQVVGNLLNNALKYTPEGGEIWLTAKREDDHAVIRVRDNGMGIAPDMLSRVFDLFAQADSTLGHSQGGLGIGLTMVRSLVQMHGGTVEAFSAGLGHGSEFVVRLPALPEVELSDRSRTLEKEDLRLLPRRILVVDDVVDTAVSLAELLRLWGLEVQMAHDGLSAIEMVRQFCPEVVLMDVGMPGMDGFEVARCLRQEHPDRTMLLVAVTGYAQESDRLDAHDAGFDAHLSKPVDLEALRELLDRPVAGSD